MTIKINGRKFDFDSDELYPGVKPKRDTSNIRAGCVIVVGVVLCILIYNGGWIWLAYPVKALFPTIASWAGI